MQRYQDELEPNGTKADAPLRTRRAIKWADREEILQLHNKLRGEVYPTASNMEYMVRMEHSLSHFTLANQPNI